MAIRPWISYGNDSSDTGASRTQPRPKEAAIEQTRQEHPLDHEELLLTVTVTHVPTGCSAEARWRCPADEKPDPQQALQLAGEQAFDELLRQLEER